VQVAFTIFAAECYWRMGQT